MKRLLLLLTGGMVALNADAQYAKNAFVGMSRQQHKTISQEQGKKTVKPVHHSTARTTASCFTTVETFGTGTTSTLPTGWTVGTLAGGTWKWANTASTSTYSMGVMNSSSAADGWMIFDSDGIGAGCSCAPSGWLQAPVYNCSAQPTVRLTFENYFRNFYDSCFVWVSNSSSTFTTPGSYQIFPVALNNNNTPVNSSTTNPSTVKINITSVAANQATVYIRFVYKGYTGGSYSWMIDNLCLSDVDAHDVSITDGFLLLPDAGNTAYPGTIISTPLAFVDTVYPLAHLNNIGANVETNVVSTAEIFKGASSVFTDNYTYPSLPLDATDTVIGFGGYKPTTTGSYLCKLSTTVTGDADPSNNIDSVLFSVTDTTWAQNRGQISGLYLYNSTASPVAMFMQGTRFDVPTTSAGDTVSGFAVSFASGTDTTGPGSVTVQLYSVQVSSPGWTYLGTSVARNVNTLHANVWTDFRIDALASGGIIQFVLAPGNSYAAIVQINGVTKDVVINSTPAMRGSSDYLAYLGQFDVSANDGSTSFGADQMTGNPSSVPMVRMFTGKVPPVAVQNVKYTNTIGKAYPNPANTGVNIPFTLGRTGAVNVTLTNVIGQVVKTQQINATSGQQSIATFTTADLTAGVYLYTVEVDGQQTTGRISVSH